MPIYTAHSFVQAAFRTRRTINVRLVYGTRLSSACPRLNRRQWQEAK